MDSKGALDQIATLLESTHGSSLIMDSDGMSTPASPIDGSDAGSTNTDEIVRSKQQAALKTYIESVPYECESPEEMETILATILSKIYIATESSRVEIMRKLDEALNTLVQLRLSLFYSY